MEDLETPRSFDVGKAFAALTKAFTRESIQKDYRAKWLKRHCKLWFGHTRGKELAKDFTQATCEELEYFLQKTYADEYALLDISPFCRWGPDEAGLHNEARYQFLEFVRSLLFFIARDDKDRVWWELSEYAAYTASEQEIVDLQTGRPSFDPWDVSFGSGGSPYHGDEPRQHSHLDYSEDDEDAFEDLF